MCTGCWAGQCHLDLLEETGARARTQAAADAAAAQEEAAGLRARLAAADAAAAELGNARGQLAAAQAAAVAAQGAARAADARGAERDDAAARERDALQEQARARAIAPRLTLHAPWLLGERLPEPQALAGCAPRREALRRARAGPRLARRAMPSPPVFETSLYIEQLPGAAIRARACPRARSGRARAAPAPAQCSGCRADPAAATSCASICRRRTARL